MENAPGKDFERLYEAADAFLAARQEGETDDEVLEQYGAVRDLLEPMLQPDGAGGEEAERRLGDFLLLREIGRGGMGIVYEAWQASLNRRVALKVLPAHLTLRRESVARFRREAKTAAKLEHPGIVDIHAIGSEGDTHYFAMEFIEGTPLDQALSRVRRLRKEGETLHGRMLGEAVVAEKLRSASDVREEPEAAPSDAWTLGWVESIVRLGLQVADALEHAHRAGVIHRDVKPSNILVREDGTTVLTDFGLVREMGLPSLTKTGDFVGTPHYVSPEQVKGSGKKLDQRSDVFSLGATLYELLTLELPFPGDTVQEVFDAIRSEDPVDPQRRTRRLAPDLAAIVLKALEKDPERRYQSAQELADDLAAFLDYRPVQARRTGFPTRLGRYGRRLLRRHPALAAGTFVGVAALLVGSFLFEGRGGAAKLEYSRLCARAEAAMSGFLGRSKVRIVEHTFSRRLMQRELEPAEWLGESPRALYDRAIGLLPGRPEAWFGRALTPGTPVEQRFADLVAARARGLSPRTYHLARAYLLGAGARWADSETERTLAAGHPPGTPVDAYFEGILQGAAGNGTEALELLTRAIEGSPRESSIRYRALRARAGLRRREGDFAGALADLHVLLDQGDDSTWVTAYMAVIWRRLGNEAEAERWFLEALRRAREKGTASAWVELCVECRHIEALWYDRATKEALAAHGDSADILIQRITFLQDKGRLDDALELWQRAMDVGATGPGLYETQAMIFVRLKRYQDALEALDRALEFDKGYVGAQRNRGNVLGYLKRFDEALAAFDEAERLDPANPYTYVSRGAMLANNLGRFPDALEQFDRAVQLAPREVDAHLNRAIVLRKLKRYPEALRAVDRAIAVAPDSRARRVDLHYLRGSVLSDLERFEDADAEFEKASRLDPKELDSRVTRGILLHNQLGRHREALAVFEEALELDSKRPNTWFNKAVVLSSLQRYDESLLAIDEAIRLEPDNADHHVVRGELLDVDLGRHAEGLAAFRHATELDPDHFWAQRNLGTALKGLEKYEEAIQAFDRALAINEPDAHTLCMRGATLCLLDKYDEAAQSLARSRELDPNCPTVHGLQGSLLMKLGKHDEALAAFERALGIAPKNPAVLHDRGMALADLGRHEEALEDFNQVIQLLPEKTDAHLHRGRSLHALGRYEEAVKAYSKVLRRDRRHYECRKWRVVALHELQRFESALRETGKMLRQRPKDSWARDMRALVLACLGRFGDIADPEGEAGKSWVTALAIMGRFEEALELAQKLEDPYPRVYCLRATGNAGAARAAARKATEGAIPETDLCVCFAYLCAAAGDGEKAHATLEAYDLPWHPFAIYDRVRIHCLLGEKEAALEWFRRAVDRGLRLPPNMAPDPDLNSIADDPRYRLLLEQMHRRHSKGAGRNK